MPVDFKKFAEYAAKADDLLQVVQQKVVACSSVSEAQFLVKENDGCWLITRMFLNRYYELKYPQIVAQAKACATIEAINQLKSSVGIDSLTAKETSQEQNEIYDIYAGRWVDLSQEVQLAEVEGCSDSDRLNQISKVADDDYFLRFMCELRFLRLYAQQDIPL